MAPGLNISYTIRWLGLPMRWTSVIAEYDPPRCFIDEQVHGPYRYWRHQHRFQSDGAGTLISDIVDYALPFGPLGRLAHAAVVKSQLLAIFNFRQQAVAELLGVPCTAAEAPTIRAIQAETEPRL
jgi:ligand-binding SRPBCC domain-containing protein